MASKRLVAVISLIVGVAVGLAAGPVLDVGEAHATTSYHYLCLRPFDNVNLFVRILNRTSKTAHVTIRNDAGFPHDETIPPHGTIEDSIPDNSAGFTLNVVSDQRLLVDGHAADPHTSHGDTPNWQVRCT